MFLGLFSWLEVDWQDTRIWKASLNSTTDFVLRFDGEGEGPWLEAGAHPNLVAKLQWKIGKACKDWRSGEILYGKPRKLLQEAPQAWWHLCCWYWFWHSTPVEFKRSAELFGRGGRNRRGSGIYGNRTGFVKRLTRNVRLTLKLNKDISITWEGTPILKHQLGPSP